MNSRTAFELARDVKAFLNLKVSLVRDAATKPSLQWTDHRTQKPKRSPRQANRNGKARRPQTKLDRAGGERLTADPAGEALSIFFLIGRSKSGTSWLMRLLNAHPEVLCRGEGKLFGKESPNSLHGALNRSKDLQRWLGHNPWTLRDNDPTLEDIFRHTVEYLMAEKLKKTKKRIVGDKSPFTSPGVVQEIAHICPGAKVVHIVRDGRDVAVSSVHHRWNNAADAGGRRNIPAEALAKREAYRKDPGAFGIGGESIFSEGMVSEIASSWGESVGEAMDAAQLLGGDYHQVRYEDLSSDPVGETRKLLEFLGADSGEEAARQCVEAASFEQLSGGRTQGEEDSTSFYRKGVAGDWKNHFTEGDREIFKQEAGELLVRLGYEQDLDW